MSRRRTRIDESAILDFYRAQDMVVRSPLTAPIESMTLTNTGHGLGDTAVLTDLPRAARQAQTSVSVFSQSPSFRTLMDCNPYFEDHLSPFWVAADRLCLHFDLGNGHTIQRLRRAFGFPVEPKPRGCVVVEDLERVPGRVIVHFEPGQHVLWQRENVHPRAREIYPENLEVIQRFVLEHPSLEFIEVGGSPSGLAGVRDCCALPLMESIRTLASAEYFIGILSGPLHLAAALGLKIVNVINFPDPDRIYLPTLRDIDQVESEWFYPQSVLLHQDGEGGTTHRFSAVNLERALRGELYPYWSDRYLGLIDEPL